MFEKSKVSQSYDELLDEVIVLHLTTDRFDPPQLIVDNAPDDIALLQELAQVLRMINSSDHSSALLNLCHIFTQRRPYEQVMASVPVELSGLIGHVSIGRHVPNKSSQLWFPDSQGTVV